MKHALLFVIISIAILLVACSQDSAPAQDDTPAPGRVDTAVSAPTQEPVSEPAGAESQTATPAAEQELAPTPTALPPVADDPTPEPTAPAEAAEPTTPGGPIQVIYFTPPQGEGPYYPLEKLDDRDNDLTVLAGASGRPQGQIVEFGGTVYDASGMPQPGILVEIWQTDASGVYLHPGDPGTEGRDREFQFYGESITDEGGRYAFRTILPGRYEPRPRHIHVKIKLDGQTLLTTQFYFADDPELAGESMFNQVGPDGEHLVITLEEASDGDGTPIFVGQRDVVLSIDLPG